MKYRSKSTKSPGVRLNNQGNLRKYKRRVDIKKLLKELESDDVETFSIRMPKSKMEAFDKIVGQQKRSKAIEKLVDQFLELYEKSKDKK